MMALYCPIKGLSIAVLSCNLLGKDDDSSIKTLAAVNEASSTDCSEDRCGFWNGRRCGLAIPDSVGM